MIASKIFFVPLLIFILFTFPLVIISLILYWVGTKFYFRFKLGYYRIYDIFFFYENDLFRIEFFLENFQIKIVWFRIRFFIYGLRAIIEVKKNEKISDSVEKSSNFTQNSKKDFFSKKEEFQRILKNIFYNQKSLNYLKENSKFNPINANTDNVEGILKNKNSLINFYERLFRGILTFFDIEIKNVNVVLKISQRKFYHNLSVDGILLGAAKKKNKNYRLNLIAAITDLKIGEYRLRYNSLQEKKSFQDINPLNDINTPCYYYNLIQITSIIFNIAFDSSLFHKIKPDGFDGYTMSPVNNMSVIGEIANVKGILSTKALRNVFKLVTDLIASGDTGDAGSTHNTGDRHKTDTQIEDLNAHIDCLNQVSVEEHILNKVSSHFKKLKITISNPEIEVVPFDHSNPILSIKAEQFMILIKNTLNKYIDNETTTILSTSNNIKMHELAVYSISSQDSLSIPAYNTEIAKTQTSGENNQACARLKHSMLAKIPIFSINILDSFNYDFKLKQAVFRSNLLSELPQVGAITMSTNDLDKILEIVMCIVAGIDSIDYIVALKDMSSQDKNKVEKYLRVSELEFRYNQMELTLFNNCIIMELNKINLELQISEKNKSKEISIKFSPMLMSFGIISNFDKNLQNTSSITISQDNSFTNNDMKYPIHSVSNLIFKEFSLVIRDDVILTGENTFPNRIKNSEIEINFPDSTIALYDDHLISIIEFVSSFLTPILGEDIKKKYKILAGRNKKKIKKFYKEKKEKIELNFIRAEIANYIDNEDILSFNFSNMKLVVDQFMEIPKMNVYHQSNNGKKVYQGKTKILKLDALKILFEEKELGSDKKIDIKIKNTCINAYCMEMVTTLVKLSNFYIFFPEWINFHFTDKFLIDPNTSREKYILESAKKDKVAIFFENILVEIKDGNIFTCGILHAGYDKLEECKNDKKKIKYLTEIKKSLFTMKVVNFLIEVNGFRENTVESSHQEESILYYKTITKKSDIEMRFEEIELTHDDCKLFGLRDMYINIRNDISLKNFNIRYYQDNVIFHRHHFLYSKEVRYDQNKNNKVNLMLKDLRLNLDDVKLFDNTLSFAFKVVNELGKFEAKKHIVSDYSNIYQSDITSVLNVHITNFEGSINSLDPVTKTVYNRLILKIYYTGINVEKNNKESLDIAEVSIYFMSFGFDPEQRAGYPLLTIPIAEVNIDNTKNVTRINIPNATNNDIKNKYSNRKDANNPFPSSYCSEVHRPELENLLVETRSITLFVSFKYLSTFVKIFEIFWEKTKFLRKSLGNSGEAGGVNLLTAKSDVTGIINKNTDDIGLKSILNDKEKSYRNQTLFTNETMTHKFNSFKNNSNQIKITEANFNSTGSINSEYNNSLLAYTNNTRAILSNNTPFLAKKNMSMFIPINLNLDTKYTGKISATSPQKTLPKNLASTPLRRKSFMIPLPEPILKDRSIILSIFDLKIIYLLEYKDNYETTFKFHPDIKRQGYFGYIMRLYTFSLKYKVKALKFSDSLKMYTSLYTVSFLTFENFDDDIFFHNDREIYLGKFFNLKHQRKFYEFMELPITNKSRFINSNTKYFLEYETNLIRSSTGVVSQNQSDLLYDPKHTLLKVSTISFKRKSKLNANIEDIWIEVENIKITWNKFNKDVVQLLIFEDVLLIVDKIILKVDSKKKGKEKEKEKITLLDLGRFNFNFKIFNPQIAIQNEIKKSTMLLWNKEPCQVIISKLCLDETSKDFHMEVINDKLCLYSFHNYTQNPNLIYWIGDSEENNFFLEERLFRKILETPVIRFNISQKVKSRENDEFDVFTNVNISVDKIYAEFEGSLFYDFMNIIEVFIFDRGYSLAEEKCNIDYKKNDMGLYKLNELENMIKSNYKLKGKKNTQKEIKFHLNRVELILAKVGKPLFQLLIKNFEGDHLIFFDNSSDSKFNIRDIQITNIENKSNDILLTSSNHQENLGGLEDKIDMVVFRKRDSYTGIGTDSQWFTLDYFELSLRPLKVNISKTQIEFFVDFFFKNKESEVNEEQQRTMLLNSSRFREISNVKKEEIVSKKAEKKDDEEYPIYFKQFKINDTELILNFQYAEGSHVLNMNNARIKFSNFIKCEKFYQSKLLDRFVSHCSKQCAKNLPSIVASLLRSGNETSKVTNVDEEEHRKLLFGKKHN